MTTSTKQNAGGRSALAGVARFFTGGSGTVLALLIAIFAVIFTLNPSFAEPPSLMAFVKKAAPLVILAIGQYFVVVSGEFDLSVGSLVGAQVVFAALMIDGQESRTVPVILVMLAFGALVGLINGLITTVLKVPSIITTLGMMLVLYGAIRMLTGGAPTGALSESFRLAGRHGIDVPVIRQLPWALLIMLVLGAAAVLLMRSPYGRTLMAVGDNETAAAFAGARVWWARTSAFMLSGLAATIAGILIGGYAGVTAQVGQGLEFVSITAVVLGGVVLGGGRGAVAAAMAGALTIEALFTLFNQLSLPSTLRPTAQGLIIIAAVAYASKEWGRRRRTEESQGVHQHAVANS
ncbi:MAG TPA: ABC transporter permease [Micromonospora sp.]|nr:ABC transporter permease [Micromonospora sp.]